MKTLCFLSRGLCTAMRSRIPYLALVCGLMAVAPILTGGDSATTKGQAHARHHNTAPARLVEIVRNATRQFTYVQAATAAGYQPFLGCVSGPDYGAMGVHYVNGGLVEDGEIDATRPEALIYEPVGEQLQLVGVEFIVDAATWLARHNSPPVLEGQTFHFVNSPNQFGLPAFFELHVWAWRDNPKGAFADWNKRVTCEGR